MSALDEIRIATPCRASWASMRGDDRRRFCDECKLHVYNLSAMTRVQAEELIAATEQRTCVRLFRRVDGTVLTSDCPMGLRETARLRLGRLVAATLALVAFAAWGASMLQGDWSSLRRHRFFGPITSFFSSPVEQPMGGIRPPPAGP